MRWEHSTPVVFAALASLGRSNPLPHPHILTPRDEINSDVLRFMKCDNLFHVDPAVGGVEDAFSGYWTDVNAQGPPNQRATSALYDRIDDFYYNGKGIVYGNNFESGVGYTQAHMDKPTSDPAPAFGTYVGSAIFHDGTSKFGFNCFTEKHAEGFQFTDEKFGICRSYVWCVQKDSLNFRALSSADVIKGPIESLPEPSQIYSRFGERYNAEQGICDPSPLELESTGDEETCTVSFECTNNDEQVGTPVMNTLIGQLAQFGHISQWQEVAEDQGFDCVEGCFKKEDKLFRQMPMITQVIARGQPPPDSGRLGYEVSTIKTTIECKKKEQNDFFCKALAPLFSVIGLAPAFAAGAGFAGAIVAASCG